MNAKTVGGLPPSLVSPSARLTEDDWARVRADGTACLAQMYLADERFTRYYDDVEPGLAQYVHDIVVASIDR